MTRWRHIAAVFRWPAIGILAVTTIVLGIIGFLDQAQSIASDRTFSEAAYRTMQLFVLEWGGMESPMPGSLEIARFFAPLVSGLAAAKTIAVLFRVEIERLWVRLFGRNHVVVCGQGATGWRLSASLRDAGWRVAGIDLMQPERPVTRWTLILGDAVEPATLIRAAAGRARHLVALCGDDATNIAVARAARSVGGDGLTIHVLTRHPDLAAMLRSEALASHSGAAPALEFFTLEERGARLLLDGVRPGPELIVCIGSSPLSERVVSEAKRRWPDIRSEQSADDFRGAIAPLSTQRSLVLVTDVPGRDALTDALTLVQHLKESSFGVDGGTTDVFVLSPLARNLEDLVSTTQGPNSAIRIHAFDLAEVVLTPHLLVSGTRESIARALHDAYRRTAARGATTLPSWDELGETAQSASREAADAVGPLLRSIGCDLVVAAPDEREPISLLPSEVELMAMLEHDRWLAWMAAQPHAPDNPNRVDWFDLPLEVRQRTEDVTRYLPTALNDVGQRVVRLDRSLARSLHDAYVARHLARGDTAEANSSLVPWDRLPQSLKDSNRDQLAHLRVKLRSIGLDLRDGPGPEVVLTADQVEQLSELEHERWVRHRRFDGWTPGGTKDPERKMTPHLGPWSDLDEETREKDREFVRSIPAIAEALGCHIGSRR